MANSLLIENREFILPFQRINLPNRGMRSALAFSTPGTVARPGKAELQRVVAMDKQPILIDLKRNEVFECGSVLLALIAYPGNDQEERRHSAFASLCALALRQRYADTPEALTPQLMKPIYAFREEQDIERDYRFIVRRSKERMVAARIAIAAMQARVKGPAFKMPRGLKRLSFNQLCDFVSADAGQSEVGNVMARIWRPSTPIIHLAAAIAIVIDQRKRSLGASIDYRDILSNKDIIAAIAEHALVYQTMIPLCPQLRIRPADLVPIRLLS